MDLLRSDFDPALVLQQKRRIKRELLQKEGLAVKSRLYGAVSIPLDKLRTLCFNIRQRRNAVNHGRRLILSPNRIPLLTRAPQN